jgi:CDP-diacylglycerol--glycerol-3-phosphate 3-phosphatidyltransferase
VNLPNWITVSRLVLTALAFVCLCVMDPSAPAEWLAWWAFGLFITAAATDYLDGYLARNLHQVTAFGRVADPFADKVLICGTLIILLQFERISPILPSWLVVVVVARELLVTTLRAVAESSGRPFPAVRLGKLKMVVQSVTGAALLSMVAGAELWVSVAVVGVWATLALTVASCVGYLVKARHLLFAAS